MRINNRRDVYLVSAIERCSSMSRSWADRREDGGSRGVYGQRGITNVDRVDDVSLSAEAMCGRVNLGSVPVQDGTESASAGGAGLLPKLGEVLEGEEVSGSVEVVEERVHPVHVPATGRTLDLYA